MKIGGFTLIKNGVRFDYPIVEAIQSLLPLVDIIVVAVGQSDDGTEDLIRSINSPKIQILPTIWNPELKAGGAVLADETNKAFAALPLDIDWAIYIQGDECLHEQDYPAIREAMKRWKDAPDVEGLLFKYRHFYGSYDYVGNSRQWYRHEIRIVRRNPEISSWKDAQGFRKNSQKLHVKAIDAWIHHYGMVRPPRVQRQYRTHFATLWHDQDWIDKNLPKEEDFDYSGIDSLAKYTGTHPAVMKDRIERLNWPFAFDTNQINLSIKNRILMAIARWTGWRIGEYRNFKRI